MEILFKKNPLQDLLSSLTAVISTNERIQFITGHAIFNGAYNEIFQLKTTKIPAMDILIPTAIANRNQLKLAITMCRQMKGNMLFC